MIYKTEEQKQLEAEFFAKTFYLSYSGLNKMLSSPSVFYKHYILQQVEELSGESINMGRVIHCLLLESHRFDEQFIIASANIPTGNTQLVVDKVFEYYNSFTPIINEDGTVGILPPELVDHDTKILEILKEINLHQSLKTDAQRIEKIISDQSSEYFEYLKTANGKTIIDMDTFEKCLLAVESVKNNPEITQLLGLENNQTNLIYNEHALEASPKGNMFGLKGILDNLNIDKVNKIVYINDLKRTGKSLVYFHESVEKYNYWAQAAMYVKLVKANFDKLTGIVMSEDWKIVFNFVVVDQYNQTYAFEVSRDTLIKWETELEGKFREVEYHLLNNDFNLPYKFATGKVIL